jgi:hypothetical protein
MKIILCVMLVLSSFFTFASSEREGGGGNAVVCRDIQENIISAKLLDLYEGEVLHKLEYESLTSTVDEKLEEIITDIYGPQAKDHGKLFQFKSIQKAFNLLPKGVALKPIDDSGHIIIPDNCRVEQVANFYNVDNIYIVSDIYNKFAPVDKLALILHEAIFFLERESFVRNSKYTRRVVAHLLSKNFRAERVNEDVDTTRDYYCSTTETLYSNSSDKKTTSFWAIRNGRDWRLQFSKINGHNVYSKKHMDVSFGNNTFPIFQDEEPNFRSSMTAVSQIESLIDSRDVVALTISNGIIPMPRGGDQFMIIKWSGFDPSDSFDYQEFKCKK